MRVRTPAAVRARGRILRRARLLSGALGLTAGAAAVLLAVVPQASAAPAVNYTSISGAGSTWAANAINTWVSDVAQNALTVNYSAVGSTTGRQEFSAGTEDFGASEIPYGVADMNGQGDVAPSRGYAYMPDVAGGTVFMYNLKIGTQRVTDLRLGDKTVADIFTGQVQYWDDPEIKADNPSLALPHIQIVPVVRADGSGATADFTQWILATDPSAWHHYCGLVGANNCIQTSAYPVWGGDPQMHGENGDTGVSGYVSQNGADGAIGYVEYSYAIQAGFPVAKVLNAAGYYTEPTPGHIAVSLLKAQINMNQGSPLYLTQDLSGVYSNSDARTYELSAYSYFILPTDTSNNFTTAKGFSLASFGNYLLCQGQQQVDSLGYSALPINLVQAGYAQLQKIPGNGISNVSSQFIQNCNNPTFDPNGNNKLAETDPMPPPCDKQGSTAQCTNATGGAPGSGGAGGNQGSPSSGPTSGAGGNNGTGSTAGAGSSTAGAGSSTAGAGSSTAGAGSSTAGPGSSGGTTAVLGGPSCDPNTGVCTTAGSNDTSQNGTAAQAGAALPANLAADNGNGQQVALMALGSALFLGLCIVPPLAAAASDRRRQQRRDRWSARAGDDEWPGGRP